MWSVEQMLEDALSEVKERRSTPTKALVLFLDDRDGYNAGFRNCGFSMSQGIALLEVAKAMFLREMDY
jgi:hypothetical protein